MTRNLHSNFFVIFNTIACPCSIFIILYTVTKLIFEAFQKNIQQSAHLQFKYVKANIMDGRKKEWKKSDQEMSVKKKNRLYKQIYTKNPDYIFIRHKKGVW